MVYGNQPSTASGLVTLLYGVSQIQADLDFRRVKQFIAFDSLPPLI